MKAICDLALAICCLAFASRASACEPARPNELFAHAEFLLVGVVTGSKSSASWDLPVSYRVLKVISGKAPSLHWANSQCHMPLEKGERVVVGSVQGTQYLVPAEWYEQSIRTER